MGFVHMSSNCVSFALIGVSHFFNLVTVVKFRRKYEEG